MNSIVKSHVHRRIKQQEEEEEERPITISVNIDIKLYLFCKYSKEKDTVHGVIFLS